MFKVKRMTAIILLVAGICVICFGMIQRNRILAAEGKLDTASGLFPSNPITNTAGRIAEDQIIYYKGLVAILFLGGAAMVVVGAGTLWFSRRG